ncbi:M24 family metallopeptidase [Rhodoligotrophos defluvii]|uniref:M24 family metallopeptidase n=1 Tax=Rhodoligotrophos defluvii TaxID=2561934 RepID=UPI0010C9FE62|nr:Xaa-Pro peptidase family protein [Rhodoligotrophos defluvii]
MATISQSEYIARTSALQSRLVENGIDLALIADPDSIIYFAGFWNYLGVEFGRPTILLVPRDGEPTLITPLMESEMCREMSWVPDVRPWADGIDGEWFGPIEAALAGSVRTVAIETTKLHPTIGLRLRPLFAGKTLADLDPIISRMRMVKSPAEIAIMRDAGKVAVAMVEGGRAAIGEGVPEYEVALAVLEAGTRRAASLLDGQIDRFVSPTIYNLQVMQSGHDTCMVHRRSSVRRIEKGDPIYLCFCGIANFKNYKLGFDREFFVGSATDEQLRIYETAVRAQQAALAAIKPGVPCEEVNAAAEEVYREAGFGPSYRTGRSIGCSFLEAPELKRGDKTPLAAGMTLAVDGGITVPHEFGGRIGDSVVVTETGFEYLTPYPREAAIL